MEPSYREYHESYLTNHHGTSVFEMLCLIFTIINIGFQSLYLRCCFKSTTPLSTFIVDVVTFVVPCIALLTVFNDHVLLCSCIATFASLMMIWNELFVLKFKNTVSTVMKSEIVTNRRAFVTNFKSVVSLLAIICILAVDFTCFPLRHAKTETYGYSLMDTGVGFFIVSNGLTLNTRHDKLIKKTFVGNLPIFILGFIRYASVEKINYQKHVTEYGVHWNFFFTLALVKLVGAVLLVKIPGRTATLAGITLALHHVILEAGAGDWVLSDAPRLNLLSANREGILSIPGYLALYLASVSLGKWLVFSKNEVHPSLKDELYKGFFLLSVGAVGLMTLAGIDGIYPASRRLANPTFVLWMLTLCILIIGMLLIWEILIICISRRRGQPIAVSDTALTLEAISKNNLLFFLLANLLTGAVNLSINTLLVPPLYSLIIIFLYVTTSCAIVTFLYLKKLTIKI